jgi:hypothetical protein
MAEKTTYSFVPKEIALRQYEVEGSGAATYLLCLGWEVYEDRGYWVGTIWSEATRKPVRVGKNGEYRRLMRSPVEAFSWWRRMLKGSGA